MHQDGSARIEIILKWGLARDLYLVGISLQAGGIHFIGLKVAPAREVEGSAPEDLNRIGMVRKGTKKDTYPKMVGTAGAARVGWRLIG